MPRKVPTEGAIVKLPEPTLPPPAIAAAVAIPTPSKIQMPKPASPDPAAAPLPAKQPASATAPATAAIAQLEPSPPAKLATKPASRPSSRTEPDDSWTKLSTLGVLGMAAVGAGVWLIRRRKTTRRLRCRHRGARRALARRQGARWLTAGRARWVVAITPQNVRMLGQWRKADAPAQLPMAQAGFEGAEPRVRGCRARFHPARGTDEREPGRRLRRVTRSAQP